MKAGINIWRALRDITDVHPAWARVAALPAGRYLESDLPRPITRKLDVGTLTGTKEFDETQVGCGNVFIIYVLIHSFNQAIVLKVAHPTHDAHHHNITFVTLHQVVFPLFMYLLMYFQLLTYLCIS